MAEQDLYRWLARSRTVVLCSPRKLTSFWGEQMGAPEFNWEETVCLNLLLQQVQFTVTVAIGVKDPNTNSLLVCARVSASQGGLFGWF
jgi:hypothetical protein